MFGIRALAWLRRATRIFEELVMNLRRTLGIAAVVAASIAVHATSLAPLHRNCTIGAGEDAGRFRLQVASEDCAGSRRCGNNFNNESFTRFTGITLADLSHEGANLTATLAAE